MPQIVRLLALTSLLILVTGLALAQGSAPAPAGTLPPDLALRRAAMLHALADPANPLDLSPIETKELHLQVILIVDGIERTLLRQTRLHEDLRGRWTRLAGPRSEDGPEQAFLHETAEAEGLLLAALGGRWVPQAIPIDIVADEWFEDLVPQSERLSLEELGRLLSWMSRDCTSDEAAVLLPEVQALRRDVRRLGVAWQALENRLDRPDRIAAIAARAEDLGGRPLPDVRELGLAWAEADEAED